MDQAAIPSPPETGAHDKADFGMGGSALGTDGGSMSDPAAFAAPQTAGDTTAAAEGRERLSQRAYELYEARGAGDGQAMEDWLTAERELRESRQAGRDDES